MHKETATLKELRQRLAAAPPEERRARFEALLGIGAAVDEYAISRAGMDALNVVIGHLLEERNVADLRKLSASEAAAIGASAELISLRLAYRQIGGYLLGVTDMRGKEVAA